MSQSLVAKEQLGSLFLPKELEIARIDDKAGAKIPLDIMLTNENGIKTKLADQFTDDIPKIITLGYFECPMLCSLVLNGLIDVLKKIKYKPGKDYKIISISIDPNDDYELARAKKNNYIKAFNEGDGNYWSFNVTNKSDALRLSTALGFNYFYDQRDKQYAHGAGFFVVSKDGVLSRTLFGINFVPKDVELAINEAGQGKIGSFIDRIILSCFHYKPDSQRYGIYIIGVMRLGALITILIMTFVLLMYFRADGLGAKKIRGR